MKYLLPLSRMMSLLFIGSMLFMSSCTDTCEEVYTYTTMEPVYLSYEDLRNQNIAATAAKDLNNPGKIYFKSPYILINERNKGIHIIDNSNPAAPNNVAFIEIAGNIDMAVKHNTLYADSYTDLLAIDITDPTAPILQNRVNDAFAENFAINEAEGGILIEYEAVEHIETYSCNEEPPIQPNQNGGVFIDDVFWGPEVDFVDVGGVPLSDNTNTSGSLSPTGVGGSMARFTLLNNHLYIVTPGSLQSYDVSNTASPQNVSTIQIGWNVETIFPFGQNLLIGTQNGMLIYDVSIASEPQYVSEFAHVTACDPVVAEGDHAFVTLRDGNNCWQTINRLDVLDISNMQSPELLTSYEMFNPHGLGIDNGTLFICDGNDGLKVYDASDVYEITSNQLAHYQDIHAFDVIPFNNLLLTIGENGFYQYNYSDLQNIELLSTIPVVK